VARQAAVSAAAGEPARVVANLGKPV
jgi:hypothetical protein